MSVDFYSVDKLIEFGVSSSAANNLIDQMNQAFDAMQVPGINTMPSKNNSFSLEEIYHVVLDGKASGPYLLTEVARLIDDNRITKESYIWKPGMRTWDYACNFPEILRLIAISPPTVPEMGIVPVKD